MEIPGNPWLLAVAVLAALVILVLLVRGTLRKRARAQRRSDEFVLKSFNLVPNHKERVTYFALPDRAARVEWLKNNYPEFVTVAERFYPEAGVETGAAYHLDLHLLKGALNYTEYEQAVRIMRNTTIAQSLAEYQISLDKINEEEDRLADERAAAYAKRQAEAQVRQKREAAELAAKKAAAKKHWDSLSVSQKEAFKKAKGKSARQSALVTSTNDSAEVFYPLIMAMEFGNINTNFGNSIDYCESSTSSHSGYSDSGYSSHDSGSYSSDSGSSYSSDSGSSYSSDSGSSSDGGGGGGCD